MAKDQLDIIINAQDKASGVLKNIGNEVGGLGSTIAKVGGLIAGIGFGAMAVEVGKIGIGFNAMQETAQTAFTTIIGNADKAKTLMADLQKFSAETPFEFPEIAAATKSMLAFGISAEDSVETLRRIGDVASGVGAPLQEIAELYGKAKVQGRLFAQDINQLTGRGIPIIQELAKQFGVSEDAVGKLVEEGKVGFPQLEKAFQSMTDKGGQFSGMMEAQSKTFDGMMSTLKDNFAQLAGVLSKPLFDIAKQGMAGLIELLSSPAAQQGLENFAKGIAKAAEDVGAAISVIRNLDLGNLFAGLSSAAGANPFAGIMSSLQTFAGWISSELMPVLSKAGAEIGTALGPALVALQPLFDALQPAVEGIARAMGGLVNQGFAALGKELTTQTIPMIAMMTTSFLQAIPPTIEFAKVIGDNIKTAINALTTAWQVLNTNIDSGVKFIAAAQQGFVDLVGALLGDIAAGFQWFIDNVISPFTNALAALKNYIGQVLEALRNLGGALGGGLPSLPSLPSIPGLSLPTLPGTQERNTRQESNRTRNIGGSNVTQNNFYITNDSEARNKELMRKVRALAALGQT